MRHLLVILICLLAMPVQGAIYPPNTPMAYVREYPTGTLPAGVFVPVRVQLVNNSSDTIGGLYFSDQYPTWITVAPGTVTVNDEPVEFAYENGDVLMPGRRSFRWILDDPSGPGGRGVLAPGDRVVISYSIRAGGEGAFTTNGDGWFGLRNSSDDTPVHGWDGHSPLLTFGNSTDVAPVGPGNLLAAPYPNPFNPSTTLRFETTAEQSFLRLAIVDTAGRQLRVLAQGRFESGTHSVVWDGRDDAGSPLPSGVYLARLTSGNGLEGSRKLMLVK
ncbi:MAG: FlgD immunoglobulin-like domain containing protein [Candidatus Krumholzibacteriia bacterium]|nr:T9SS type A sorting domain-containing protein [bacterium]MCB9513010.1 T9SS type A sorting domain-containing protein [Candidatus Latescibacterota bacterium]MCB9516331.1 T9SS type A sorting domain-containing protein [Candidatus Latescibacterota bacterium]